MSEIPLTPEIIFQMFAETRRQMAESNERLERMFTLSEKAFEKRQKAIDKKMAQFTDTLGRFAEDQVRPAALRLFANLGIPIYEATFNSTKLDKDKTYLYEVDILLHNTDVVVAIEVKSTLRKEDVDEHVERLKLMQQFPLKGTRGTQIIGAMAAMNAQKDVVAYAIKNGFYVILPDGSSVGLVNPNDFKPRKWEIL
jgi:hypothetical protein